ncbi:MAG: DUF1566 domain-containing protein, partial [Bacteroidales bacterium]|nr:DUF1566 domain-containing protein [Bacteroidales bacterium]
STTSNVNGLITIKIGNGDTYDHFEDIDWSDGPYFLQTEIDPEGGINYTINGTTQFLSVPYALHALTATSISGDLNETDPLYSLSSAASISNDDIINWNNKLEVEKDSSNTNEIQHISKTGSIVTLSKNGGSFVDSVNVYKSGRHIEVSNMEINYSPKYKIGDYHQGGIIFWVDPSGDHGLIISTEEAGEQQPVIWGDDTLDLNFEQSTWSGAFNTEAIVTLQDGLTAAILCDEYEKDGYSDWFLPSVVEWNLIYNNIWIINKTLEADNNPDTKAISGHHYWTSNEYDYEDAYSIDIKEGEFDWINKTEDCLVRAIREF